MNWQEHQRKEAEDWRQRRVEKTDTYEKLLIETAEYLEMWAVDTSCPGHIHNEMLEEAKRLREEVKKP